MYRLQCPARVGDAVGTAVVGVRVGASVLSQHQKKTSRPPIALVFGQQFWPRSNHPAAAHRGCSEQSRGVVGTGVGEIDGLCDGANEGTIRFHASSLQACLNEKWRSFVASACPAQVRCAECGNCEGCVSDELTLSGTCSGADVGDVCHAVCPAGQLPTGGAPSLTCGPTLLWSGIFPDGCRVLTTQTFSNIGDDQPFTVPSGVSQISVYMWGAGGGGHDPNRNSGAGGYTECTFTVSPGDELVVVVGVGPEEIAHRAVMGRFLHAVKLADIV